MRYQATKLALYKHVPRIISEMRVPSLLFGRSGDPTLEEISGGSDIVYRLFCDEAIRMMATKLGVEPQAVFDALDLAISAPLDELERHAQPEDPDA